MSSTEAESLDSGVRMGPGQVIHHFPHWHVSHRVAERIQLVMHIKHLENSLAKSEFSLNVS
jgi:hypothetical protein